MCENSFFKKVVLIALIAFGQMTQLQAAEPYPCDSAQLMIDAFEIGKGEVLNYKGVVKEGSRLMDNFQHEPEFDELKERAQTTFNNYKKASDEAIKNTSQLINKITISQNIITNDMIANNCGGS